MIDELVAEALHLAIIRQIEREMQARLLVVRDILLGRIYRPP